MSADRSPRGATRRRFATALAAGGLPAAATRAQTRAEPRQIGLLSANLPTDPRLEGFFGRIRSLGYVEGRTIVIHGRYAGGQLDRLPELARELVALKVEVIVALAVTATEAAPSLGFEILPFEIARTEDVEPTVARIAEARPDAMLVTGDPLIGYHIEAFIDLVAKARMPTVYALTNQARAGGLIGLGPRPQRPVPARGGVRRQDPARGEPRGAAGRAADDHRAGDQPAHRERARARDPAFHPQPRRRDDRMTGPDAKPRAIEPAGWAKPKGYANGVVAEGRFLFIAGQIGWNPATAAFESDDFAAQARQALANVRAMIDAAGASPDGLVRMTWYVTDKRLYLAATREVGAAYREILGATFPPMTLIEVKGLLEDRALVEIEATVRLP